MKELMKDKNNYIVAQTTQIKFAKPHKILESNVLCLRIVSFDQVCCVADDRKNCETPGMVFYKFECLHLDD